MPLAFVIGGDPAASLCFLRLAIYLSVLKWIGWACLTRQAPQAVPFLRWPAELFSGLAVVVAWFYLRNLLALIWPASYSLFELRLLFYLILFGHGISLASLGRSGWKPRIIQAASSWVIYLPFFLTMSIVFREVASSLQPQSTDPMFHAFAARIYEHHSLFLRQFNGGEPIRYASGFGAVNATACALSGLTAVQAVALQHSLWLGIALFAITCTCGIFLGTPLRGLHAFPLLFLILFPLHNLQSNQWGAGTPRQLSPALMAGAILLPAFFPAVNRRMLALGAAVACMLVTSVVALNPACLLGAAIAMGGVLCLNGRASWVRNVASPGRVLLHHAVPLAAGAVILLLCDQFYGGLVRTSLRPKVSIWSVTQKPFEFSFGAGWSYLWSRHVVEFAEDVDCLRSIPGYFLPLAISAGLAACLGLFWFRLRKSGSAARGTLVWMGLSCAALWILSKVATLLIAGGLPQDSWDTAMLASYLMFLQVRVELLLAFAGGTAAFLYLGYTLREIGTRRVVLSMGAVLVSLLVLLARPYLPQILTPFSRGVTLRNSRQVGKVTVQDLDLVAWVDAHLGVDRGLLGLAAVPFRQGDETHIYPHGGAQAIPLYGRTLNFCFFNVDPGRRYGYDDYLHHVRDRFDATWCSENNIRYFYVSRDGLDQNPGLADAIRSGFLVPVRAAGESAVYAVGPPPR